MSNNWDLKTDGAPVLTQQMVKEANWFADNRFATVKEPYPVDKTVPFKKMTKSGLDNLIKSVTTTPESVDAEIKRVTETLKKKGIVLTDEMLANIKKSMLSTDVDALVNEARQKAIQHYKNTVFDKYKIELNFGKSESVSTDMWLAYLHYSKEQHDIQASKGVDSKELRDHIRQHGQLVKNG